MPKIVTVFFGNVSDDECNRFLKVVRGQFIVHVRDVKFSLFDRIFGQKQFTEGNGWKF